MDAQLLIPRSGDDAYVDITVYLFDKVSSILTIVTHRQF